jgi:hypothetical protein
LDARCPFWSPGDKVPHEAEALTLAASLFPDQGREIVSSSKHRAKSSRIY